MNDFTIYCTEAQTKKALELGAPIDIFPWKSSIIKSLIAIDNINYEIPTAEQMLGWLEEQGLYINFDTTTDEDVNNCLIIKWEYFIYNKYHDIINDQYYEYPTRKKAILAAIDAALEYLINNKK